jgi:CPA1 family monovalent cation:H+ antiporter
MFRFAVAAALTGAFSPAEALLSFATAVVVGILAGFTCLWFSSRALKILAKLKNGAAESQVLIILILPFLAYLLAELFHASGVLAAVTAGLFGGRYGMTRHIGVSARMLMTSAWHMLAFALNGAIFVFLGLQLPAIAARIPPEIAGGPGSMGPALIVLALTLCLMALRSAFMFGGGVISRIRYWFTKRQPDPRFTTRMNLVAAVGGVRGAITLAGVLSLPLALNDGSAFPARDLVIFLAAGVIVFWLVIAALTLPFLTAGFSHMGHERAADEMRAARIAAAEGAIAKLEEMSGGVEGDEMAITTRQAVASQLIAHYRRRIVALEQGENLGQEQLAARKAEAELRGAAIAAEMDTLRRMLRSGQINDQTLQALFRDLTLGQAMIASHTER